MAFFMLSVLMVSCWITGDQPAILAADRVVFGSDPKIELRGLVPGQVYRLHAVRVFSKWQQASSGWKQVDTGMHAWAEWAAPSTGTISVSSAVPVQGTYLKADPLGLLRTGFRMGSKELTGVYRIDLSSLEKGKPGALHLLLEQGGKVVVRKTIDLVDSLVELTEEEITQGDWHATYARPRGGSNLPLLVTFHGSEGGSLGKSRALARSFAKHGFATLAVNYFSYEWEAVKGIPTKHFDIRIELVDEIRKWRASRAEIDQKSFMLHGVSKGAEFALLAASQYDWITKVVAVVPSDAVWEGYSAGDAGGSRHSSWSKEGKPWPFIPLYPFEPAFEGMYRTNTERYERSRNQHPAETERAKIPIEKTRAQLLLLASDRDEVWASGAMARNLVERMIDAGKRKQVSLKIYPTAGHMIAGDGTFPVRLYGEQSADPSMKNLMDEGDAAADAWQRTLAFLKRADEGKAASAK